MAHIRHPLSAAIPFLSRFLDAEPIPLPGDTDMPRVQGPSWGASERLVVSPGREEHAIFEMPGGQSGHPLSPYYLAGHGDVVSVNYAGLPTSPWYELGKKLAPKGTGAVLAAWI